jgi:hypothetical protein
MKITLRKMKSSPLGGKYDFEFFTPLLLEHKKSVVSITVNSHSSQYYNIQNKYGITWERTSGLEYSVAVKKQVVLNYGTPNFVLVPSTFASNKAKIDAYSKRLVECFAYFNYVHFTHFGYLKSNFPKVQIIRILLILLSASQLDCEICWDIDEKFHTDMKELLDLYVIEKGLQHEIEIFEEDTFTWNEELRLVRASTKLASEQQQEEDNRRAELVTRQRTARDAQTIIPIGTGAAGTAGEFYALSLFIRKGFVAGKAPEGTALYDLFVMTPNAFSFAPVQVKTVTNSRHWMLSQRHEEVVSNLIFCFVLFSSELTQTRVFLVPAAVVSNVIRTGHEIWMALPGLNGATHTNGNMRTLKMDFSTLVSNVENPSDYLSLSQLQFLNEHSLGWLDRYENNFEIFNTN